LLHLTQIDDTITAGANEDWVVQPAFTFHKRAANEELAFIEMYERGILECLENGNALDARESTFAIVGQQNESARGYSVWLALFALR
jgi:hypothetical protein